MTGTMRHAECESESEKGQITLISAHYHNKSPRLQNRCNLISLPGPVRTAGFCGLCGEVKHDATEFEYAVPGGHGEIRTSAHEERNAHTVVDEIMLSDCRLDGRPCWFGEVVSRVALGEFAIAAQSLLTACTICQ